MVTELVNNCLGVGAYHELVKSIAIGDKALVLGQKTARIYTELLDW